MSGSRADDVSDLTFARFWIEESSQYDQHGPTKSGFDMVWLWHSKVDPIVDFHTSYGAEVLRIVPDFRPEDVDNQGVPQQNFVDSDWCKC